MNIKRIIDKNGKLIWYIALIIVFALLAIRFLNSYYEKEEQKKSVQFTQSQNNKEIDKINEGVTNNKVVYSTESKTITKAIKAFVHYCNNKEIENAYKMLTDECKKAMFPTVEEFEKNYVNNIFNIKRTCDLEKWSTDENKNTYLISLYGDILATGETDNYTQDYYTLIKNEEGVYRLNINSYIYGEDRNLESKVNNITVKIGNVDIYEEYEKATITIINNTSKTVCLTGDKSAKKIYLQNSNNITYSSLNSQFDNQDLILEPNSGQTYTVEFNKIYDVTNKAQFLVLSDVILDYDEYLNSEDKASYSNRTNIKVIYDK